MSYENVYVFAPQQTKIQSFLVKISSITFLITGFQNY